MENHLKNPESWGNEVISMMTFGKNYQVYRGFATIMNKILSVLGLVLLRHRFGVYFVTWTTLFWADAMMSAMYLTSSNPSSVLFLIWGILINLASLYHIIESRRNLRRGKSARHSLDWGESLLAPLFAWLIVRLKLENFFLFRNMTDFSFKKWTEPMLLFSLGFIALLLGSWGFGFVLMAVSVSIFRMALGIQRHENEIRQRMIDAGEYSQIMSNSPEEKQRTEHRVARPVKRLVQ